MQARAPFCFLCCFEFEELSSELIVLFWPKGLLFSLGTLGGESEVSELIFFCFAEKVCFSLGTGVGPS